VLVVFLQRGPILRRRALDRVEEQPHRASHDLGLVGLVVTLKEMEDALEQGARRWLVGVRNELIEREFATVSNLRPRARDLRPRNTKVALPGLV
jgi:hypothetical protein